MLTRYVASRLVRPVFSSILVAATMVAMAAAPAAAHGGSRVFFGFNTFVPTPNYYPPPYYYPPAYYYPPPAVYAPAPGYGSVQPQPATPTYQDSSGRTCREFQTTIQVDGQWQPSYGTACLQPDGSWQIVN